MSLTLTSTGKIDTITIETSDKKTAMINIEKMQEEYRTAVEIFKATFLARLATAKERGVSVTRWYDDDGYMRRVTIRYDNGRGGLIVYLGTTSSQRKGKDYKFAAPELEEWCKDTLWEYDNGYKD